MQGGSDVCGVSSRTNYADTITRWRWCSRISEVAGEATSDCRNSRQMEKKLLIQSAWSARMLYGTARFVLDGIGIPPMAHAVGLEIVDRSQVPKAAQNVSYSVFNTPGMFLRVPLVSSS
jgi:hypothetical protein